MLPDLSMTSTVPHEAGAAMRPGRKPATVLVPLDGTEDSLAALPIARLIADLEDATLHVVHIAERILSLGDLLEKLGLDVEDIRGSVVDQAAGAPAEGIVRLAGQQQSPYIVMCTHTGHKGAATELGAVAAEVVQTAPCPVILVPPERERPVHLQHILLPHDGTPTAAAAARPALEFAETADAELLVLHVTSAGTRQPDEPGSIPAPLYVDQAQYEWPAWAQEFLERAHCPPGSTHRLRMALAVGDPGDEIARFARSHHVDLVVLGWHGNWEREHAVAVKTVLRSSPCPVLLLRVQS